jgi:hypothetical protein
MTPASTRALRFWLIRVAVAILLVVLLQAWTGPDPVLWWAAGAYVVISGLVTLILIRRGG